MTALWSLKKIYIYTHKGWKAEGEDCPNVQMLHKLVFMLCITFPGTEADTDSTFRLISQTA